MGIKKGKAIGAIIERYACYIVATHTWQNRSFRQRVFLDASNSHQKAHEMMKRPGSRATGKARDTHHRACHYLWQIHLWRNALPPPGARAAGASADTLEQLFPPESPAEKVGVADASDLVHPDVVEEDEEGQFPLGQYLSSQHRGLARELLQQGTSGTRSAAQIHTAVDGGRFVKQSTPCLWLWLWLLLLLLFVFHCLHHANHGGGE